jgi:hypothetical protein
MKTLQALAIFIIFVGGILAGTSYMKSYAQGMKEPVWYAQNRHRVPLPSTSQWFEAQRIGERCRTWFTCTQDGARLRGIYLDQNGNRHPVGSSQEGMHFIDTRGRSLMGEEFDDCAGGHNGISVNVYPEVGNDGVVVRIAPEKTDNVEVFRYPMPAQLDPAKDATAVVVFEAETGGIWQVYEQSSSIRGCSGL